MLFFKRKISLFHAIITIPFILIIVGFILNSTYSFITNSLTNNDLIKSFNNEYSLVELYSKKHWVGSFAIIDHKTNDSSKLIAYSCPDDYAGKRIKEMVWGNDCLDVFVISYDVGVSCYKHINGNWERGYSININEEKSGVYSTYLWNTEKQNEELYDIKKVPKSVIDYLIKVKKSK